MTTMSPMESKYLGTRIAGFLGITSGLFLSTPRSFGNPNDPNENPFLKVESATLLESTEVNQTPLEVLFDRVAALPGGGDAPSFSVKKMAISPSSWSNATFEDLNDDGKPDLVVASGLEIRAYLNEGINGDFRFRGDGELLATREITNFVDELMPLPSAHFESAVSFGDADNDGDRDLICGERWHGNVLFFPCANGPYAPGEIRSFGSQHVLRWKASNQSPKTNIALGGADGQNSAYPNSAHPVDLSLAAATFLKYDDDDHYDLLVADNTDATGHFEGINILVYRFEGLDAENGDAPYYADPVSIGWYPHAIQGNVVPTIADVDGLNGPDLVISLESGEAVVAKNSGARSQAGNSQFLEIEPLIVPPVETGYFSPRSSVIPVDADGDGDLDIVVSKQEKNLLQRRRVELHRLLPGADIGNLSMDGGEVLATEGSLPFRTTDIGGRWTNFQMADLNGDDALDVVQSFTDGSFGVSYSIDTGDDFDAKFVDWVAFVDSQGEIYKLPLQARFSIVDADKDGVPEGILAFANNSGSSDRKLYYAKFLGTDDSGRPILDTATEVTQPAGIASRSFTLSLALGDLNPNDLNPSPDGAFVTRQGHVSLVNTQQGHQIYWAPFVSLDPVQFGPAVLLHSDAAEINRVAPTPFARDVDQDGDVDLLLFGSYGVASSGNVRWFENLSGSGSVPTMSYRGVVRNEIGTYLRAPEGGNGVFCIFDHPKRSKPLVLSALSTTPIASGSSWSVGLYDFLGPPNAGNFLMVKPIEDVSAAITQTLVSEVSRVSPKRIGMMSPIKLGGGDVLSVNRLLASGQLVSFASIDIVGNDADGDGLRYEWEIENAYNPNLSDSDQDGILDQNEDRDLDGLTNAEEFALGTVASNPDSDEDGISDGWERRWGLDPLNAEDGLADLDGDGVSNLDEFRIGTVPLLVHDLEEIEVEGGQNLKPLLKLDGGLLVEGRDNSGSDFIGSIMSGEDPSDWTLDVSSKIALPGWNARPFFADSDGTIRAWATDPAFGTDPQAGPQYEIKWRDGQLLDITPLVWRNDDTLLDQRCYPIGNSTSMGAFQVLVTYDGLGEPTYLVLDPEGLLVALPKSDVFSGVNHIVWCGVDEYGVAVGWGYSDDELVLLLGDSYGVFNSLNLPGVQVDTSSAFVVSPDRSFAFNAITTTEEGANNCIVASGSFLSAIKVVPTNGSYVRDLKEGTFFVAEEFVHRRSLSTPADEIATLKSGETDPAALASRGYSETALCFFLGGDGIIGSGIRNGEQKIFLLSGNNDKDFDGLPDDWEAYWAATVLASGVELTSAQQAQLLTGQVDPGIDYTGGGTSSEVFQAMPAQMPKGNATDESIWCPILEATYEYRAATLFGFNSYLEAGNTSHYFTEEVKETYSVSGSWRYEDDSGADYTVTTTELDGTALAGEPSVSTDGDDYYTWLSSQKIDEPYDEENGEYLVKTVLPDEVDPAQITNTTHKTTTKQKVEWKIMKDDEDGNPEVQDSGTEVITKVVEKTLSDSYTPKAALSFLAGLPPHVWTSKLGPLDDQEYMAAIRTGDQAFRQSAIDHIESMFVDVSYPITIIPRALSSGDNSKSISETKLTKLRWKWVKFNPDSPLAYFDSAPPAANGRKMHLISSSYDTGPGNTRNQYDFLTLDCPGGLRGWQEVPVENLARFMPEEPFYIDNATFKGGGWAHTMFILSSSNLICEAPLEVPVDDEFWVTVSSFLPTEITSEKIVLLSNGSQLQETPLSGGFMGSKSFAVNMAANYPQLVNKTLQVAITGGIFNQNKLVLANIQTRPGDVDRVELEQPQQPFVADNKGKHLIKLKFFDRLGNPVLDGTDVDVSIYGTESYRVMRGVGPYPYYRTSGNEVEMEISHFLTEDPKLVVSTPGKKTEFPITFNGLAGGITSTDDILVTSTGETATLSLSLSPLKPEPGTEVFWMVSKAGSGAPKTFVTAVDGNGSSQINISSAGAPVGKCYVTATVARTVFFKELSFVREENQTWGGELGSEVITQIGDVPVPGPKGVPVVNRKAPKTQEELLAFPSAPQLALPVMSWIDLSGPPNSRYRLALENPGHAIRLLQHGIWNGNMGDVNGLEGGFTTLDVTMDASGQMRFPIIRKPDFHIGGTQVAPVIISRLDITAPIERHVVALVEEDTLTYCLNVSWDMIAGFFGADTTTHWGAASGIAGGVLVVGDFGGLAKNFSRAVGWSDKEVDRVETAFCALGAIMTVGELTGVGIIPDAVISGLRQMIPRIMRIARQAGGEAVDQARKFLLVIGDEFSLWMQNGFEGTFKYESLIKESIGKASTDFNKVAPKVASGSADDSLAMVKNLQDIQGPFIRATAEVAKEVSADALQAASRVLADLPPARLEKFLEAAEDVQIAAIKGLAKTLDKLAGQGKNVVDAATMRRIVANDFIFTAGGSIAKTSYTVADLFKEMGEVTAKLGSDPAALDGFRRLILALKSTSDGVRGVKYELEVAAHFARQGKEVSFIRKYFGKAGAEDLDLVVDGVIYEIKLSKNVVSPSIVTRFVSRVLEDISEQSLKIRYCLPAHAKTALGTRVTNWLKETGVFKRMMNGASDEGRQLDLDWFFEVPYK